MLSHLMKSGNSLAIRIPKTFAEDIGLKNKSPVEMHIKNGSLILTPVKEKYRLQEMVAMINDENLHHETETGSVVGNEVW